MRHIVYTRELISPKLATKYLTRNIVGNRRSSPQSVNAYSEAMQNGTWFETHEAIAFDTNGALIDGQQRLQAIIESGTSQYVQVARNVQPRAFGAVNAGKPRNGTDMARWLGHADNHALRAAIAGRLLRRTERRRVLNTEYPGAFKRYSEGIEFVLGQFPKPLARIRTGAVCAALVRAYYKLGRETLEKFCQVLVTGISDPSGVSAVILRDWLMKHGASGEGGLASIYLATGYMVNEFANGNKDIKRIKVPHQEVFVMPWEEKKKVA